MKEAILALVAARRCVLFHELPLAIPNFAGDVMMTLGNNPNAIIWPWFSEEAITAVEELLRGGIITLQPYDPFLARCGGHQFPALRTAGFKNAARLTVPHWLPACLRIA